MEAVSRKDLRRCSPLAGVGFRTGTASSAFPPLVCCQGSSDTIITNFSVSMLYFHFLKLQICMEISLHAFHYYFNLRKFFRISFRSLHLISSYMVEWHLHCSHCSLLCTRMEYCKWKELYFMPCCMWKCHLFLQTTTESSIGILYSMTELMYFPFLCIVTERKFYNFFVF